MDACLVGYWDASWAASRKKLGVIADRWEQRRLSIDVGWFLIRQRQLLCGQAKKLGGDE
jgi:hypothetical protein